MEIKRFFVNRDRELQVGTSVEVSGDEYIHAIKVSRYKVGYRLILSNGDGYDYFATITEIGKDRFFCHIDERKKNENELSKPLSLYLCGIERSDFAVQKATEVGASRIRFLISEHTNAKEQHLDRLKRIALESAKQCGRAVIPEILSPVSFADGVKEAISECGRVIICYEDAKEGRIAEAMDPEIESYALVIGSEGGFTPDEVSYAESLGAKIVTLGRRILRAETACIAGLVLMAEEVERYENSGH